MKSVIIVLLLSVTIGCSKSDAPIVDVSFDMVEETTEVTTADDDIRWGFVTSTAQLVRESVDPNVCESGWSALVRSLGENGEDDLPPLQPTYVNRFETAEEFTNALEQAFPLVEDMPTLRVSLMWPCWIDYPAWRGKMVALVQRAMNAGYRIELTLSHHDSYPISLHDDTPNFGIARSGWANDDAPEAFASYVKSVAETFGDALPEGTRVYLINEPVAMLFNGYLGSGNWPPGGKHAGTSFAKAMRHMRDGLKQAAAIIADHGWEPTIAKNIRPVTGQTQADQDLDFVFNWWLLDALVYGCEDDQLDQTCDPKVAPAGDITVIGVTFYGTMHAGANTVALAPSPSGTELSPPVMDFAPDSSNFETALQDVASRYEDVRVAVAEIGFHSTYVDTMADWLSSYRGVVTSLSDGNGRLERSIMLHTLFKSAEFSQGEWQFHAVEGRCLHDGQVCTLTEWGKRMKDIVKQ